MSRLYSLVDSYRKRRFAFLFFSLLITLGLHPIFEIVLPEADPTPWLFAFSLVAAVLSVELGRRMRSLIVLAAGFILLRIAHPLLGTPVLLSISQVLWMSAIMVVTVLTVEHAFRRGHAVSERIFAALDAYLLAGFAFGAVYWFLERELPGSFGPAITTLSPQEAVYLSFFTLTTLGLGNVVPSNGPAQGIMIFEALAGQMYLIVLVARLVSLYSSEDSSH
ncbi:MAG: ion channel [Chromatiales bacterium]